MLSRANANAKKLKCQAQGEVSFHFGSLQTSLSLYNFAFHWAQGHLEEGRLSGDPFLL